MEAMVFLVAHELMHIQQFRAKARCSEQETEHFGMARLTAWRELIASGNGPVHPHFKEGPKKPEKPKDDAKLKHAQTMLAKNMTKMKRAETIVKKWKRKVQYYEKKIEKI